MKTLITLFLVVTLFSNCKKEQVATKKNPDVIMGRKNKK